MPFLDTNSHLTTKPYNFDIKCQSNSESYDWHNFFETKFRGGQIVLLLVGVFFNEREYSGADWMVPLLLKHYAGALKYTLIWTVDQSFRLEVVAPLVTNPSRVKSTNEKNPHSRVLSNMVIIGFQPSCLALMYFLADYFICYHDELLL